MAKRKPVSVRVRFNVFKRDGFKCQYCGRHPSEDVMLVLDHVLPVAAGGSNDPSNLRTACQQCNGGKSDTLLIEGELPSPTAKSLAEKEERLRQAKAYAKLVAEEREHDDDRVAMVNETWAKAFRAEKVVEAGRSVWRLSGAGERFPTEGSVRKMLKRLPLNDLLHAIDVTEAKMGRASYDAERYFFGVCWKMVSERDAAPPAPPTPKAEVASPQPVDFDGFDEPRSEDEPEWFACSPAVTDYGQPYNHPEWWDWQTRGEAPERWLTTPIEEQDCWVFTEANKRRQADPDAGEPPKPFLNAPGEPTIRNPMWVRYWAKYGYSQASERIREEWGPEGVGNYPCVRRPRIEETMSREERVKHANNCIAALRARTREPAPWKPWRVGLLTFNVLHDVLDPEDVFLDKSSGTIGFRVRINEEVIVAVEPVCEDGYEAVAYYAIAEQWTPPGVSLAAYWAEKRPAAE